MLPAIVGGIRHAVTSTWRFAARVEDMRRMSFADRRIMKAARLRFASTACLYADLVGYQREDV